MQYDRNNVQVKVLKVLLNIDNSDGIGTFLLISNGEREPIMMELIKVIDNELN